MIFASPKWVTQGQSVVYWRMFVRKKKNRSGTTSVVVVSKHHGKFKELITIGVSSDSSQIEYFTIQAKKWIDTQMGSRDIYQDSTLADEERQLTEVFLSRIENVLLNGVQYLLDKVYRSIGFDRISDDILRHLVIARLSQPMSKLATVDYLKNHFDEDIHLYKVYRYLDKLYKSQQELIQKISVDHTNKVLQGNVGIVFYDVTTLYFETDNSDELRENGFSKDGKHSHSQVVLGLLVTMEGYPLSYSLFNGSQYEGYTMIPIVEDYVQRFKLKDFVVVADSGLMNSKNVKLLQSGGYKYIIGARIKSEADAIKKQILEFNKEDNAFKEIDKMDSRLVVHYSADRARKDAFNREKGVKRLQNAFKSGKIKKENINKRGYNKFLTITDNVSVTIDDDKIKEDQKWDGLKGYLTNTRLPSEEVYRQYNGLWVIEKAFRVTKGTLEIRPVFHFTPKRIEAHVCICFVAFKVYKELERILKNNQINHSVEKVISIAKTITTIKVMLPYSQTRITKTMILTKKQKSIASLFEDQFWKKIQGDA